MIHRVRICPVCSHEFGEEHRTCPNDGIALVNLDTGADERGETLVGQVVGGRYRIEKVVGRGGMGTVYACRHVVVGKAFAIKVLRPGVERSTEVLQRFIREAQAANAVRSRHICEMVDFGQLDNGAFYVVMDLLEGVSLTRALRDRSLDQTELRRVFVQIAETLERAHRAGIVHRDLKPDNVILVDDDGDPHFVKLVDFGIAKMMQADASHLTETGIILGTPYYMSPEQARGDAIDARSDIYALGVMMYRAFTGKLPFVADTAMGVLTRHLIEAPVLPSRVSEIDPIVERVILRCMEKQPIDRFQSMADVAEAIRHAGAAAAPVVRGQTTVNERSGSALRAALDHRLVEEGLMSGAHHAAQSQPMPAAMPYGAPGGANPAWAAAMQARPPQPALPYGGPTPTPGAGMAALDPRGASGPFAPAAWPAPPSQPLALGAPAVTGPHQPPQPIGPAGSQPYGAGGPMHDTPPPTGPGATPSWGALAMGQPVPPSYRALPPQHNYGYPAGHEGTPRDLAVEAFTNRGLVSSRLDTRAGSAKGMRLAFLAFGALVMLGLGTVAAIATFHGDRGRSAGPAPAGSVEVARPAQSTAEGRQPGATSGADATGAPDTGPAPSSAPGDSARAVPPGASGQPAASGSAPSSSAHPRSSSTYRPPPPPPTSHPEIRSPFE
jgi:eukaryotic-like serine/threonine-protein kinase